MLEPEPPSTPLGEQSASLSRRQHLLDMALSTLRAIVTPDDGNVIGIYLLTFLNHWNFEQERFVVLTSTTLMRVKYNFISQRVERVRCQRSR